MLIFPGLWQGGQLAGKPEAKLKKLEVALVFFLHFFRDYLKQARALSQASVSGEIKTGTVKSKQEL